MRRKNVTVRSALMAMPRSCPVLPSKPLGTSTASTGRPALRALMAANSRASEPSTSRESPAPNTASTMHAAPRNTSGSSLATGPSHRAAISAASPVSAARSPSSATRTSQPPAFSSRAATKPSPPLLPGPHSTAIRAPGAAMLAASAATARPAFSISVRLGTPASTARRSARAISSVASNSCPLMVPDYHAATLQRCHRTRSRPGAYCAILGQMPNFQPADNTRRLPVSCATLIQVSDIVMI